MFKTENLSVKVNNKKILKKVNLDIKKGKIHVLFGPNASGKSTLAYTIMGFPKYKITKGKMLFQGENINSLRPEERAKLGIALVFQHPPVVKEVRLNQLLEKISSTPLDIKKFSKNSDILQREINLDFSGGERKFSEIIQVISLNPKFVIFDELDSGLDIEKLKELSGVIKEKLFEDEVSALLITHRGDILRFFKPDMAHVMIRGEIVGSSKDWKKVWQTIKKYGYEKCRECKKL